MSKLKKIQITPIKPLFLTSLCVVILVVIYRNADNKYVPQIFVKQTQNQETTPSSVSMTTISQMTKAGNDNDIVEEGEDNLDEAAILNNIKAMRIAKAELTRDIKTNNSSQADAAFRYSDSSLFNWPWYIFSSVKAFTQTASRRVKSWLTQEEITCVDWFGSH
jgi:capsule polysaccharide export protein KpsE/RkpR